MPSPQSEYMTLSDEETVKILSPLAFGPRTAT